MTGLALKEVNRLIAHVEKQGVTVTRTTKGFLMRLPNGETQMVHKTDSDWRSARNMRAVLQRSGIDWPFERVKHDLPQYITRANPTAETLANYRAKLGDPLPDEVNIPDVGRLMYPDSKHADFAQIYRALYALGYRPSLLKEGKLVPWIRVKSAVDEHPEIERARKEAAKTAKAAPKAAPATKPEAVPAAAPAPATEIEQRPVRSIAPAAVVEGREFIDTADSWTLDLAEIGTLPVQALAAMMKATGLEFEVRCWRKADSALSGAVRPADALRGSATG